MIRSKSLKKNLIILLSLSLFAVMMVVFLVSFISVKDEITEVFDADLVKSSKLIFGLVRNEIFEEHNDDFELDFSGAEQQKIFHRYEYKIHSQIWNKDKLIYNSDERHVMTKPENEGFNDIIVDEKDWRSFVLSDVKSDITVLVMEELNIRNKLLDEILYSLFLPLILFFIPLFFIVVIAVKKALRPLDAITDKITKMSSSSLEKFQSESAPLELRPFIDSFNSLLDRLNEAIESERRFTDYAAHELKTPLATITIQAQLLLKNKNAEKQKEYLNDLINGIDRMTHMINQLLTLARLETESKIIKAEEFNIKSVLENLLQNYGSIIEKKNLQLDLKCDLAGRELFVKGNRIYVEIMLRNLIDNAIKYGFNDTSLTIEITGLADDLSVKIINCGEQISQEEAAKIFDNFYRTHSVISQDKSGCGLGLAIVKKIIDLHGGSVAFESLRGVNSVAILFSN